MRQIPGKGTLGARCDLDRSVVVSSGRHPAGRRCAYRRGLHVAFDARCSWGGSPYIQPYGEQLVPLSKRCRRKFCWPAKDDRTAAACHSGRFAWWYPDSSGPGVGGHRHHRAAGASQYFQALVTSFRRMRTPVSSGRAKFAMSARLTRVVGYHGMAAIASVSNDVSVGEQAHLATGRPHAAPSQGLVMAAVVANGLDPWSRGRWVSPHVPGTIPRLRIGTISLWIPRGYGSNAGPACACA